MVEVGEVEHLQVHAARAQLGEVAELVDDLVGRADQADIAQIVQLLAEALADRGRTARDLGVVATDADRLRSRVDQRIPAGSSLCSTNPVKYLGAAGDRPERDVELVGVPRGELGCAALATAADDDRWARRLRRFRQRR